MLSEFLGRAIAQKFYFSLGLLCLGLMHAPGAHASSAGIPQELFARLGQLEKKYSNKKCDANCVSEAKALWKDSLTNYGYDLWYEPQAGTPVKGTIVMYHSYSLNPGDFPYIMVARYVANGYRVLLPVMSGHGNSPDKMLHLDVVEKEDWINDADFSVRIAELMSEQVAIGGYSTGALVAIHRAIYKPGKIKALLVFAPALWITAPMSRFSCLGRWLSKKDWAKSIASNFTTVDEYRTQFIAGACAIRNLIDDVIPPAAVKMGPKDDGTDWYIHMTYALQRVQLPVAMVKSETQDEIVDNDVLEWFKKVNPNVLELKAEERPIQSHLCMVYAFYLGYGCRPTPELAKELQWKASLKTSDSTTDFFNKYMK